MAYHRAGGPPTSKGKKLTLLGHLGGSNKALKTSRAGSSWLGGCRSLGSVLSGSCLGSQVFRGSESRLQVLQGFVLAQSLSRLSRLCFQARRLAECTLEDLRTHNLDSEPPKDPKSDNFDLQSPESNPSCQLPPPGPYDNFRVRMILPCLPRSWQGVSRYIFVNTLYLALQPNS